MVFADLSRQFSATFINGTARNGESTDAIARAMRRLFSEIRGKDGRFHNLVVGWFGLDRGKCTHGRVER